LVLLLTSHVTDRHNIHALFHDPFRYSQTSMKSIYYLPPGCDLLHYSPILHAFFILSCSLAQITMCNLQQLCVRPQNNGQKCTVSIDHHRSHGNRRVTQITHTRLL